MPISQSHSQEACQVAMRYPDLAFKRGFLKQHQERLEDGSPNAFDREFMRVGANMLLRRTLRPRVVSR